MNDFIQGSVKQKVNYVSIDLVKVYLLILIDFSYRGVMHLARDYYSHDRSIVKTLVCYNAGCGRLPNDAWKNIKETREYIPKVKKYFDRIVSL